MEAGERGEYAWYRSDRLKVLACGVWDESGEMTRYAVSAPAPHVTVAGIPGRVTYYPGQVIEEKDGLWSYAAPWQTYWPFSRYSSARQTLDTGEYGGIIRFENS